MNMPNSTNRRLSQLLLLLLIFLTSALFQNLACVVLKLAPRKTKFRGNRDTVESSHDSGGGILGHLLHEISGQIVVGNSNGCSNKLDFDM